MWRGVDHGIFILRAFWTETQENRITQNYSGEASPKLASKHPKNRKNNTFEVSCNLQTVCHCVSHSTAAIPVHRVLQELDNHLHRRFVRLYFKSTVITLELFSNINITLSICLEHFSAAIQNTSLCAQSWCYETKCPRSDDAVVSSCCFLATVRSIYIWTQTQVFVFFCFFSTCLMKQFLL